MHVFLVSPYRCRMPEYVTYLACPWQDSSLHLRANPQGACSIVWTCS